ncbi:MAG: GNAT family N-acetyltransferase [Haloarculaceae archaeon]
MVLRPEIRQARRDDAPTLDVLRRQAVEAAFGDAYDRGAVADVVASASTDLETWTGDDRYEVLVVETDVTPVGYGALERCGTGFPRNATDVGSDAPGNATDAGTDAPGDSAPAGSGSTARLVALYTSPDHEGEGYATALLNQLVATARAGGCDAVRAVVPTVSAGFFEKRDFEADGGGDAEWHGLPAVGLVRPL